MKLTASQIRVLKNLRAGHPASYGCSGRSEMGGLSRTIAVLRRHNLVRSTGSALTKKGREIIDCHVEQCQWCRASQYPLACNSPEYVVEERKR